MFGGKYNASEKLCIPKTSHIQRNQSTPAIWFVDEIRDTRGKKTEFEKKSLKETKQETQSKERRHEIHKEISNGSKKNSMNQMLM